MPPDSNIANWGPTFVKIGAKLGKGLDTFDTMKAQIEAAGFEDMHEKLYKVPLGDWAKNTVLREAGKFNKLHLLDAMEGYAMYAPLLDLISTLYGPSKPYCLKLMLIRFLLTKFGEPEPWSAEEVQVYLAKVRDDINNRKYHAYSSVRRIWARKPLNA